MKTGSNGNKTSQREVIAGVRVVESEYRVQRPVFKDITIERPVYVDKQVEIPVGMESFINKLGNQIAERVMNECMLIIDKKLKESIENRTKEIQVPKVVYKEEERKIMKPVFHEVDVAKPIFKNKEVINIILRDVEVQNPIFKDVEVERPVFKEHVVPKPKFEEVIIQKPKWVEKEVTAIHLKYVDPKGNPDEDLK